MSTYYIDYDGRIATIPPPEAQGMMDPVRCQCGTIYDTADVKVIAINGGGL